MPFAGGRMCALNPIYIAFLNISLQYQSRETDNDEIEVGKIAITIFLLLKWGKLKVIKVYCF